MTVFVLVLAVIWGGVWALALEYVPFCRWIAVKRTWLSVVIGVGGDLALLAVVLDWDTWLLGVGVIAASSVGIIMRSLANEMREWHALMEASRGTQADGRE